MLAAATIVIAADRNAPEFGPRHLALDLVGVFREPTYIAQPPGERDLLFVTTRRGAVWVLRKDARRRPAFLNLRPKVTAKGGQQGLLSIAFAPDYATSGLFYVAYTARHGGDLRVVELRRSQANPLRADPASARTVLTIPQQSPRDHGGQLAFGPDGYLYIGTGDGGPANDPFGAGQSKAVLTGKILRIDPRARGGKPYTVPRDNPFVRVQGARPEIYAYGLHNPERFSFDPQTGLLAIGDLGQSRYEEIDIPPIARARGANFGWSAYEGFGVLKGGVPRRATVLPTLAYPHHLPIPHHAGCAVVGGYLVRDRSLAHVTGTQVLKRYIFGDQCTGQLRAFRLDPEGRRTGRDRGLGLRVRRLISFGEDQLGRLYAISLRGPVYRIFATRRVG